MKKNWLAIIGLGIAILLGLGISIRALFTGVNIIPNLRFGSGIIYFKNSPNFFTIFTILELGLGLWFSYRLIKEIKK